MFQIPDWEDSVPSTDIKFDTSLKKKRQNRKINCGVDESKPSLNNKKEKSFQHNGFLKRNKNTKLEETSSIGKLTDCPSENVPQSNIGRFVRLNHSESKKSKVKNNLKSAKKQQKSNQNMKSNTRDSEKLENKELIKKRPLVSNINKSEIDLNESINQSLDTENLDGFIINTKKRKLNSLNSKEEKDVEETSSRSSQPLSKKKKILKNMLLKATHRNAIQVNGNSLRERMLQKLKAAQFRYINEKLYTSSGSDAKKLFQEDPDAFKTYHQGYQQQVKKWPVNPIDVIVKRISNMPKTHLIADMGCGEAVLSQRVIQTVRSFDLVSFNSNVEVCDIAHTPLFASSVDVAVYCLALMGTDLTQYLVEANRILKTGGHLLIAEVESRFEDVDTFVSDIQKIGFSLKKIDKSNQVFYFMEFTKVREPPKKSKLPYLTLKPCFYKKR